MKKPSKQTWLTIVLLVLITINIAALVHFFFYQGSCQDRDRPEHYKRHQPADFLKEELNLTDEQNVQMEALRHSHKDTLSNLMERMREKRNLISMEMMKQQPDSNMLFGTCDSIGIIYSAVRKLNVLHYWKMKNICNNEQKKKLDTVFKGVFCCDDGMYGRFKKNDKQCCPANKDNHPCSKHKFQNQ